MTTATISGSTLAAHHRCTAPTRRPVTAPGTNAQRWPAHQSTRPETPTGSADHHIENGHGSTRSVPADSSSDDPREHTNCPPADTPHQGREHARTRGAMASIPAHAIEDVHRPSLATTSNPVTPASGQHQPMATATTDGSMSAAHYRCSALAKCPDTAPGTRLGTDAQLSCRLFALVAKLSL